MVTAKTIAVISFLTFSAFAQTQTTGRIAGTVKDQNDALIVGANVKIINQANGEERTATTDAAGNYAFSFLAPAVYRLRIAAQGFNIFNAESVSVSLTETTTIEAALTVAGIAVDPITINNSAPLIRTDSPTLGSAFNSRTVAELPLSTRNFTQLLRLSAGTSIYLADNTAVGRNTQNVSVNGSRVSQNNFQINGVDANAGISFNRPIPNPAPESIAEFKVQTSLFDATFGRLGGGNVQVVTKAGRTNITARFTHIFAIPRCDRQQSLSESCRFAASDFGTKYLWRHVRRRVSTKPRLLFCFVSRCPRPQRRIAFAQSFA